MMNTWLHLLSDENLHIYGSDQKARHIPRKKTEKYYISFCSVSCTDAIDNDMTIRRRKAPISSSLYSWWWSLWPSVWPTLSHGVEFIKLGSVSVVYSTTTSSVVPLGFYGLGALHTFWVFTLWLVPACVRILDHTSNPISISVMCGEKIFAIKTSAGVLFGLTLFLSHLSNG